MFRGVGAGFSQLNPPEGGSHTLSSVLELLAQELL